MPATRVLQGRRTTHSACKEQAGRSHSDFWQVRRTMYDAGLLAEGAKRPSPSGRGVGGEGPFQRRSMVGRRETRQARSGRRKKMAAYDGRIPHRFDEVAECPPKPADFWTDAFRRIEQKRLRGG